MSETGEQIMLSTPRTMRARYPNAGWVSIDGEKPMRQYPETFLPRAISDIVREIVTKAEAAIAENRVEIRQPQTISIIRSMSFAVAVDLSMDRLRGWRGRIPRPGRKETLELYRRAGWDSVNLENSTYRIRDGIRTIILRLTYWQKLPEKCNKR